MLAYLDPGTGSSIAAVLASGAIGAGVAWKLVRQRLAERLGGRKPPGNEARDPAT